MQKLKEIILGIPFIYNFVQWIFTSEKGQKRFINFIDAKKSDVILDIGCGTGFILDNLPKVKYYGYDMNNEYLKQARKKYADLDAEFRCEYVSEMNLPEELQGKCDKVFAFGVLHHLTDPEVKQLFNLAKTALKPEGKLITIDPVFIERQGAIAKFLVGSDRGQFVRHEKEYRKLFSNYFAVDYDSNINNLNRLPYTHILFSAHPNSKD